MHYNKKNESGSLESVSKPKGGGEGGTHPYPPQGGYNSIKTPEALPEHTHLQPTDTIETSPTSPTSPSDTIASFEKIILERSLGVWDGTGAPPVRVKRLKSTWSQAQRFLSGSGLDIYRVSLTPDTFYTWVAKQTLSLDYCGKILDLLNHYGRYMDHVAPGRTFHPIPKPRGIYRERIRDAFNSTGKGKVSRPLTSNLLSLARKGLPESEYRWLYISFYLGLRPSEVDALHKGGKGAWKVITRGGVRWLMVYQAKLKTLPEKQRWKAIPLQFPSQRRSFEYVEDAVAGRQPLHRPSADKLQRKLGVRVTTYAGRKGFAAMMLNKRVSLKAISKLLGHRDEAMTRKHYSDPVQVQLVELSKLLEEE